MTTERFAGVPRRLKQAIGRLIKAPAKDIILANSASYGLHLIANGFPWQAGDEVLVMRGDFPSDILPWLGLEPRGVTVRQLVPRGRVLEPEVEAAIGPRAAALPDLGAFVLRLGDRPGGHRRGLPGEASPSSSTARRRWACGRSTCARRR